MKLAQLPVVSGLLGESRGSANRLINAVLAPRDAAVAGANLALITGGGRR